MHNNSILPTKFLLLHLTLHISSFIVRYEKKKTFKVFLPIHSTLNIVPYCVRLSSVWKVNKTLKWKKIYGFLCSFRGGFRYISLHAYKERYKFCFWCTSWAICHRRDFLSTTSPDKSLTFISHVGEILGVIRLYCPQTQQMKVVLWLNQFVKWNLLGISDMFLGGFGLLKKNFV